MRYFLQLLLIFFSCNSFAQEIPIQNLDLVSLDTKDNVFVSTTNGDIYQFNSTGKQINLFSPGRQGRLQQLEAAWTVNIFSFSSDLQEYRILDRFLNPLSAKGFQQADISLVKAATLGNNNIIWIWDESDLSLKTLDYLRNLIIQSQPLNLILNSENLEVLEIREFKNRLFMNVAKEGVFIFDNQANFLKKVNLQTNQKFSFYRERLFWLEAGMLSSYDLGSDQIFNHGEVAKNGVKAIQIGKEKMVLIFENSIEIIPLPESLKSID